MPARHAFHNERVRRSRARPVDPAVRDLFEVATTPVSRSQATPASQEAADLAYLRAYTNALRALRELRDDGAMTSNECADRLQVDHQALRPRFTQMKARGWLEALEERRPTGHGGKAHVHRITDAGRAILLLLLPHLDRGDAA